MMVKCQKIEILCADEIYESDPCTTIEDYGKRQSLIKFPKFSASKMELCVLNPCRVLYVFEENEEIWRSWRW